MTEDDNKVSKNTSNPSEQALADEIIFFCEECDKESKIPKVLCCGKPMKKKPMEMCTKATASAEHARFQDEDDACDEGRGN